jgi:hypothetical protein
MVAFVQAGVAPSPSLLKEEALDKIAFFSALTPPF